MNEHHHDDRLCPGCAAEIVNLRALTDDLAAVLDGMDVDLLDLAEVKRVLARYRAQRDNDE